MTDSKAQHYVEAPRRMYRSLALLTTMICYSVDFPR